MDMCVCLFVLVTAYLPHDWYITYFTVYNFRLNIADSGSDSPLRPADLGPLYQNQEADPEIAAKMMQIWLSDEELPDL